MRESNEKLLKGVKKVGIVKTENLMEKGGFKKNSQNEFKNKLHEKRMHGQFVCEMPDENDNDLSWKWLVQSDLRVETEATICAVQEQTLRTNYIKNKIDKKSENPLCRMCRESGETVQHIIGECKKLAHKRRHKRIREDMTQLQDLSIGNRARSITLKEIRCGKTIALKKFVKDDDVKVIWDINIQCDNVIKARRPNLILVDKEAKSCVIIDVTIASDGRIGEKEIEKIEKYQNLKRKLKRLWSLKNVEVVPVVVAAVGCINKGFSGRMDTLGIKLNVGMVQKSVLLGTATIFRKVLDMQGESILLTLRY